MNTYIFRPVKNDYHDADDIMNVPYPEPVYTGWSSVHWNATGWPNIHWDTTGRPSEYL